MTVKTGGAGAILLEGDCPVEDAEMLLNALLASPRRQVDWRGCLRLHTAVLQIVLASHPSMIGPCGDPFVEQWITLGGQ
jgi:hypothetical protein